ncbi:MAG: hypothetical protein OEY22_00060 [Candidatus Bathyarchaeota archaeon]|nr:hypothetical protein [Candidatus Bathyarchaeota archaeon]MDH5786777.1 hypothetical protein [Candidatus Bathyarchaeota archaeon]
MMWHKRKLRANSSGQLLIVAALAIAILISSTTIYVYEVSKEINSANSWPMTDYVLALKQSTRNTVVSSLVNASNGGEETVLTANLNELSEVLRSLDQFGICQLDFYVSNDSAYDMGVRLSWNTSDSGVSSAYANFTLNVYGIAANLAVEYTINVTTLIAVNGYYTRLAGDEKLVNLTCNVFNEGKPALAKNISLFYETLGSWIPVNSSNNLSVIDCGNGTYTASFTVDIALDTVTVSAHIFDLRDVFVQAKTTCYEA